MSLVELNIQLLNNLNQLVRLVFYFFTVRPRWIIFVILEGAEQEKTEEKQNLIKTGNVNANISSKKSF